jgi:mannose-6-phosphate isomerase
MVWGGRALAERLGKSLPDSGPYGESWELSDHPLHYSIAVSPPWTGHSLRQLMEEHADALLGPAAVDHSSFPWLVKFLDARDWLSVQVHPDQDAVRRLRPGERSKNEAWFVIHAEPDSRIYAGLARGVTEGRFRDALEKGSVIDCLHGFSPQAGDCIYLPAGTVHAVGGGVLLAEVQETSDATFRLFDWNRRDALGKPRPLHIDEGLESIHWPQALVEPVRAQGFAEAGSPAERRQTLVECPYFSLEYLQGNGPFGLAGDRRVQIVIVLGGHGRLEGDPSAEEIAPGQVWLLPASSPAVSCRAGTPVKLLVCTLP